ncbi:universal stress protein [Sphaerotilaceae bacterium SBD11-9]
MGYRSLLVLLDHDPLCSARTRVAIRLAKSFDARLSGFAPTGLIDLPSAPAAAASMAEFAAEAQDTLLRDAESASRAFEKACAAAGFSHGEAIVEEADTATALLHHALCHDLTILSQPDPSLHGHAVRRDLIEQVVLFSARPTLLLPYAGSFEAPLHNVMVAWDGSREAARAIADALPLLHQAHQVHLVAWQERGLRAGHPVRPRRLDEVRQWLKWHGVEAQIHVEPAAAPIAEAMLSRISDLGADLLVMGAWGHTRWSERVLGGATRGLLAAMTVPVLMSH